MKKKEKVYAPLPGQNGHKCIRRVKMSRFITSIARFTLPSSTRKQEHLHSDLTDCVNTHLNKCDSIVCIYTALI